jgi:hypothetical protein
MAHLQSGLGTVPDASRTGILLSFYKNNVNFYNKKALGLIK